MNAGSTSQNLRIRAEELDSLLRGLPVAVLRSAFELTLQKLDAKTRALLETKLRLAKSADEGVRAVMGALAALPKATQDAIAAQVMEAAARASLGSDD